MKKYKLVLWMVQLEEGLSKEQISKIIDLLKEDISGYMPIEIEGSNNSSAIGFICASYYDELSYSVEQIKATIQPVLDNWDNESDCFEYTMPDGTVIYMGCDYMTI